MRLLIQRVNHADVKVDGETVGSIGKGFLVLVGVGQNDTREIADKYLKKMLGLRIFEDANGKTISGSKKAAAINSLKQAGYNDAMAKELYKLFG